MNDQIQPEGRAATPPEPGLSEGTGASTGSSGSPTGPVTGPSTAPAGGVGVYETQAQMRPDEPTGSSAVNTYDRPAATARSGPNVLAILLLLVILALLAYAAFQLVR